MPAASTRAPFAPRLAVPVLFVAAFEDRNAPYDFAADAQRLHESGPRRFRALLERFVRDPAATAGG